MRLHLMPRFYLQTFYTNTRRLSLHFALLNSNLLEPLPKTVPEWQAVSSTKMNALIEICQYHMKSPDRPPLRIVETVDPEMGKTVKDLSNRLEPNPDHQPDARVDKQSPDKIIVFSAYPFHNSGFLIPVRVSALY